MKRSDYDPLTNAIRRSISACYAVHLGCVHAQLDTRARQVVEYQRDLESLLARVINDRESLHE